MSVTQYQLHLNPELTGNRPSPAFTHLNVNTQRAIIQLLNGCRLLKPVRIPLITTVASFIADGDRGYVGTLDNALQQQLRTGTTCTFFWTTQASIGFEDLRERVPGAEYVVFFCLNTDSWNMRSLGLANALVDLMESCLKWGSQANALSIGFRFSRLSKAYGLLVFDTSLRVAFNHVKNEAEQGAHGFALHRYADETLCATRWLGNQDFTIDACYVDDILCYVKELYSCWTKHLGSPLDHPIRESGDL